ncbi:MAG: hypothetical protein HY254_02120 [Burkholderiales bacterium]|nr:hypothetical protein [Burkholderiales bacterium]
MSSNSSIANSEMPENLMYQLIALRDELNRLVLSVDSIGKIFDDMTLTLPKFDPSELGFIRTVSWLYGLYYEAGKIGVNFLIRYLEVYDLDADGQKKDHFKLVQRMRTFIVHNLDLSARHDQQIAASCQQWFKPRCGSSDPNIEEHWRSLLLALLADSIQFLKTLRDCVKKIEVDESMEIVFQQWALKLKRYHPPHAFDSLIPSILDDIGRAQMDPMRLRSKYYADWHRALECLNDDYIFEDEARKLIEFSILSETNQTLPISGKDIIENLNVPAGPKVGELLETAKQIYAVSRCEKLVLLRKLKEFLEGAGPELSYSNSLKSISVKYGNIIVAS